MTPATFAANGKIKFEDKWQACSKAEDCSAVRIGSECSWTAIHKSYVEHFNKWNGSVNPSATPIIGCEAALKNGPFDNELVCERAKCGAKSKPKRKKDEKSDSRSSGLLLEFSRSNSI